MKNIFFFFLIFFYGVALNAGGDKCVENSKAREESVLEQRSLNSDADLPTLLLFLKECFTELKTAHQAASNSNTDQKTIDDFLGQCRDSLQEVTTLFSSLDETTRNNLLNSPQADVYKNRLQQLEIVTAWAKKDPLIVAAFIAQISKEE